MDGLYISIVVVIKILCFFEFISYGQIFIKSHGFLVGGDGLSKFEELREGEAFSSVGFREVGFDVDTAVAVFDTLMEHVEIVVADGSVGEEAMIFGVGLDGLGIVFDCLLIVFVLEGFVALFFPLFSGFLDVHF